jgi:hypothetical protein
MAAVSLIERTVRDLGTGVEFFFHSMYDTSIVNANAQANILARPPTAYLTPTFFDRTINSRSFHSSTPLIFPHSFLPL